MPEAPIRDLQRHLLRSGVSTRYARRTATELNEHFDDLMQEAIADGLTEHAAVNVSYERLGDLRKIAAEIICRNELKTWVYRYPVAARVLLPVAYLALLPITPVFAGVARAQQIARWGACLMLSAVVTAAMFFAMQVSIALV